METTHEYEITRGPGKLEDRVVPFSELNEGDHFYLWDDEAEYPLYERLYVASTAGRAVYMGNSYPEVKPKGYIPKNHSVLPVSVKVTVRVID